MLRSRRVWSFTVCLLLVACATTQSFDKETEPGGKPLPPATTNTVVLTGAALSGDPGLTVLDVIRRAMPQLRISGWSSDQCPILTLRGQDTVLGNPSPSVYVDGTHAVNTCPLTTLQAVNARRVEVYPGGVTPRAGYENSGHGLILIFLKTGGSGG
jgi:hypothetical protein